MNIKHIFLKPKSPFVLTGRYSPFDPQSVKGKRKSQVLSSSQRPLEGLKSVNIAYETRCLMNVLYRDLWCLILACCIYTDPSVQTLLSVRHAGRLRTRSATQHFQTGALWPAELVFRWRRSTLTQRAHTLLDSLGEIWTHLNVLKSRISNSTRTKMPRASQHRGIAMVTIQAQKWSRQKRINSHLWCVSCQWNDGVSVEFEMVQTQVLSYPSVKTSTNRNTLQK